MTASLCTRKGELSPNTNTKEKATSFECGDGSLLWSLEESLSQRSWSRHHSPVVCQLSSDILSGGHRAYEM